MRFITFGSPGKPCLVKYFKWLLTAIKGQELAKDQTKRAYLKPKGPVPSGRGPVRTLIHACYVSFAVHGTPEVIMGLGLYIYNRDYEY